MVLFKDSLPVEKRTVDHVELMSDLIRKIIHKAQINNTTTIVKPGYEEQARTVSDTFLHNNNNNNNNNNNKHLSHIKTYKLDR